MHFQTARIVHFGTASDTWPTCGRTGGCGQASACTEAAHENARRAKEKDELRDCRDIRDRLENKTHIRPVDNDQIQA